MEIIAQLNRDLADAQKTIASLLRQTGQRAYCPRCGDIVFHLRHWKTGDIVPYGIDGKPHAPSCTKAYVQEAKNDAGE